MGVFDCYKRMHLQDLIGFHMSGGEDIMINTKLEVGTPERRYYDRVAPIHKSFEEIQKMVSLEHQSDFDELQCSMFAAMEEVNALYYENGMRAGVTLFYELAYGNAFPPNMGIFPPPLRDQLEADKK